MTGALKPKTQAAGQRVNDIWRQVGSHKENISTYILNHLRMTLGP